MKKIYYFSLAAVLLINLASADQTINSVTPGSSSAAYTRLFTRVAQIDMTDGTDTVTSVYAKLTFQSQNGSTVYTVYSTATPVSYSNNVYGFADVSMYCALFARSAANSLGVVTNGAARGQVTCTLTNIEIKAYYTSATGTLSRDTINKLVKNSSTYTLGISSTGQVQSISPYTLEIELSGHAE